MDAKHRLKKYVYHVLVAIDQLFNALTGGAADETLSSRTYRGAQLAQKPKTRWKVLYTLINGVFFDRHHCRQAYISELDGRQHDARFNQSRAAVQTASATKKPEKNRAEN